MGFTVNPHPWHPAFPPPYVIAIVALDEDPLVRLTTNIVGCEPDEVHIGQRVRVRFEQHDDVWLPLFEPTGEIPDAAAGAAAAGPPPAPARCRCPRSGSPHGAWRQFEARWRSRASACRTSAGG